MLSPADNEILTLTGPGTAMGTLFRRFWMPVALSDEIAAPDSPPCRVQVLGEYMLLFRQTDGQIGLIEPKCAHRGADLYWGRNEECGLRCVYHGWKYNAQGQCVDIPNMRPGAARDNMAGAGSRRACLGLPRPAGAATTDAGAGILQGAARCPVCFQEIAGMQLGAITGRRGRYVAFLVCASGAARCCQCARSV